MPDLAPDGRPAAPYALVDVTTDAPEPPVLDAAQRAATSSSQVLIGRSRGVPHRDWHPLLGELACTLVGGATDDNLPVTCIASDDVDAEVASLAQHVTDHPIAGTTLVRLLGLTSQLLPYDGLVAESLAYSMLLGGPEFETWLAQRHRRDIRRDDHPPVLVERTGDELTVTLNRPARHNAYSSSMRDALVEALEVARWDETVSRVVLQGAGPSFCSGGDLDEFGTTPDPATAHVIRLTRNVAALLDRLHDRLEVRVHGACIGAGTEFAAFGGTVLAGDDAFFQLPEVRMGLVPGAGGTVSVRRRIGRWRTAYLALSGGRIDVARAMAWKLVDGRADG